LSITSRSNGPAIEKVFVYVHKKTGTYHIHMLAFKPFVKDFSKILPCKKRDKCKNVGMPLKPNLTGKAQNYYYRNRQMNCQKPLQRKQFYIGPPITKRNVGNKNQY
jgi:hypothetical protein